MDKISENEKGFSAVEVVLVLVIVVLIGTVGWLVYKNHHKTTTTAFTATTATKPAETTKSTSTTTQTTNPYSGWLTYTTQIEKLSFKYPNNWTIKDNSGTQADGKVIDNVNVTPPDGSLTNGFTLQFRDGQFSGVQANEDTLVNSTPVTFLGQSDYILYYSAGATPSDTSTTALSTSYVSTSSTEDLFPTISWDTSNSWDITLVGPYTSSNDSPSNPDFVTAKLIIESATH